MTEIIVSALRALGYQVFTRPYELNIIGIRATHPVPNSFGDSINVLYKDDKDHWHFHSFSATTDPGSFWLKNPSNPDGAAVLKAGQYLHSHIMGMHRGKYMALVQRGPLTVIRNSDRTGQLHFDGKEETGFFGINIHRAMETGTATAIDKFSAGCQVFASAADFQTFMSLCERQKNLYGNSFSYTLVNHAAITGAA